MIRKHIDLVTERVTQRSDLPGTEWNTRGPRSTPILFCQKYLSLFSSLQPGVLVRYVGSGSQCLLASLLGPIRITQGPGGTDSIRHEVLSVEGRHLGTGPGSCGSTGCCWSSRTSGRSPRAPCSSAPPARRSTGCLWSEADCWSPPTRICSPRTPSPSAARPPAGATLT